MQLFWFLMLINVRSFVTTTVLKQGLRAVCRSLFWHLRNAQRESIRMQKNSNNRRLTFQNKDGKRSCQFWFLQPQPRQILTRELPQHRGALNKHRRVPRQIRKRRQLSSDGAREHGLLHILRMLRKRVRRP